MDLFNCNWDTAKFLIFSENVFDPLIYYSHLLPMISSLLLGLFVYLNNRHNLINKLFFALTLCFSIWVYFDLILWASEKSELIMFFWSAMIYVEYAMFIISFWLLYTFLFKKKVPNFYKVLFTIFSLPIVFLSVSEYSLIAYSLANCDREPFEGVLWSYLYLVEFIVVLMTILLSIKFFIIEKLKENKIQHVLFSVGIIIFLTLFFVGNVVLIYLGSSYEQYKLFGMLLFLSILLFIIVKFKTFNMKIIATQALVWVLILLIGAQLSFTKSTLSKVMTSITLIFVIITSYYLVRSVKQVEKQKELLQEANQNQQSLLHFITHQVKGYMTKSRNIFDAMITGDYGEINPKVMEVVKYGFDSDTRGVQTVQSILKASDLKTGKTEFKKEAVNISAMVAELVENRKDVADQKGLDLTFEIDPNITTQADPIQIREVFKNIISNSITYTQKGTVHVTLKHEGKNIKFAVVDTGFGLTLEDKQKLFTEGGKSSESLSINIDSTGYGLYIAKKIVQKHDGKIGAHSDGRGKGSEFFVILPQIS